FAFDTPLADTLAAGERHVYEFTVNARTLVAFDAHTSSSTVQWSLTGPFGGLADQTPFVADGFNLTGDAKNGIALAPGTYRLTVGTNTLTPIAYGFKLLNLSAAPLVALDTIQTGQLSPTNETDAYRISVTTGDKLYFNARNSGGYWRLLDPEGREVFNPGGSATGMGDVVWSSPRTATYTLLIDGPPPFGGSSYEFAVRHATDLQRTLTLDTTVTEPIPQAGQRLVYNFNLPQRRTVYLDVLDGYDWFFFEQPGVRWSLLGPSGTVLASDTLDFDQPILDLTAGDYTLIFEPLQVETFAQALSFRLLDLSQASALPLDTPTSGTLDPATSTDVYQFTGTAGQRLFLEGVSGLGRLLDEFGAVVPNNGGVFTLTRSGPHTLLVEGSLFDLFSPPVQYTLALRPVTDEQFSLALDATISEAIEQPGQRDRYTFTLEDSKQLVFDALTNDFALRWALSGPRGFVVDGRSFNGSDGTAFASSPVLDLVAGTYTLTIARDQSQTGAYSFRLLDVAAAPAFTPGTPVNGGFGGAQQAPGNGTNIHRFNVVAGEQFTFSGETLTGTAPQWRLLDPWGQQIFGP